ncbi:11547_t:CDS:2, partial [Scutellospora calospora]
LKEKYQYIVFDKTWNDRNADNLLSGSLERWAVQNVSADGQENDRGISTIITATSSLCNIDVLKEQNFDFLINNYNGYNRLLLVKLPFNIFPKLLKLFKPLEYNDITKRNIEDMLVNASNILTEISQYTDLEHK